MKITVSAKQIGKRGSRVAACPRELNPAPDTLRRLIGQLVSEEVARYEQRLQAREENRVLTDDQIEDMSQVGRIGFGLPYGSRRAELSDALETAYQGFEDGLYRVFIGDREIESLDGPLELREGDNVTILRLVMLTGGYF